ncbi:Acid phosphatase [Apiospora arundinis]|uniref:Acid phosphatase n=1 Tax=Apiospora arundinis TaxID=335852 RepID=A0ABR2II86_9PEZI
MHPKLFGFLAAASLVAAAPGGNPTTTYTTGSGDDSTSTSVTHTATATSDIAAAAATAKTESPTSNVKGKAFDRIFQIYLETTAYENATADPNCQALIKQGILLTEEYGVGAPSQPNYIAPASGDTFGLNSDSFILVNKNVSTIVDLLEDKGISWGDYNEGLPYTGFDGFAYDNPVEGDYVRKHNLLARFNSVMDNPDRAAKLKNFTLFYEDLEKKRIPQWGFITPNLYNNGHDTNITVSCNWTRSFVEPLLANEYFNDNAVIYITWQANGQNPVHRNHVAGILLGSAIPKELIGTTDDAYHNHYSELSSVEANWGLHTLGRWDVGANVWKFVAAKTGDVIRSWNERIAGDLFENYYWNQSYGGVFSSAVEGLHVYVAPNTRLVRNGRTVLPSIVKLWARYCGKLPDYYRDIIELPDALHPPTGFEVPIGLNPPMPIETPITIYPVSARSDVNQETS